MSCQRNFPAAGVEGGGGGHKEFGQNIKYKRLQKDKNQNGFPIDVKSISVRNQ